MGVVLAGRGRGLDDTRQSRAQEVRIAADPFEVIVEGCLADDGRAASASYLSRRWPSREFATEWAPRPCVLSMDAILAPGSPTMSDDAFLPLVYSGGTFEDLYRREYPNLIAVARVLTGDRHDGEDLVQDTMVKAFVHWDRLRSYQKPGCWCLRVLTHACRDHWRRRRTRTRFLDRQRNTEPWTEGPNVEFVAFWQAVRRLPQRPRLVVTLFYAGDRSIAEIAAVVKAPEGTVKSDLARARVVLMSELER